MVIGWEMSPGLSGFPGCLITLSGFLKKRVCWGMGEEVDGEILRTLALGVAPPRCHLTIPPPGNRRRDSTGSWGPAPSLGQQSPVGKGS